jgi:hypothetical protein
MILNYIGQLFFYIPMIYLNLNRLMDNKNCCLWCYKHEQLDDYNIDEANNERSNSKRLTLDGNEITPHRNNNNNKRTTKYWIFSSNIFILIVVIIFLLYLILNLVVFFEFSQFNLPMVDVLPHQSYLAKHLKNHLQLFDIGPIIMLAFIKPFQYHEESTYKRIMTFIADVQQLDGKKETTFKKSIHFNILIFQIKRC